MSAGFSGHHRHLGGRTRRGALKYVHTMEVQRMHNHLREGGLSR